MTVHGGERLAEVIYLPGATPPPPAEHPADQRTAGQSAAPDSEEPERGPRSATRAENIALHALTRRGQSRRELEDLLRRRDLDEAAVQAELARLEGVGLIDDHALAEQVIRVARDRKGLGRTAIAAELKKRKLDSDTIEQALAELDDSDGDSEYDRALALAQQRAGRLHGLDRDTAVRRLSGYLQRKGYSGDTVRRAVDTALEGRRHTVRFQ